MLFLKKLKRLSGNLWGRRSLDQSLDEELRSYVDDLTDRGVRSGLTRDEARRAALVEIGGIERVKEEVRGVWIGHGIETTIRDIRHACRGFVRAPAFAAVVILTLTLGIGTSVTMFSVMHAALWRPLPYPDADRIVMVEVDARGVSNAGAAPGELLDLRSRSQLLERWSMVSAVDANMEFGDESEHLAAASVTDDFLPLLGGESVLGRSLQSQADDKDYVRSVLISDALWRRKFATDPRAVGRHVKINNLDMQVVGVLRPGFRLYLPPSANATEEIDVWFASGIENTRQYRGYSVAARLRPGVSLEQAQSELAVLAAGFVRDHPEAYPDGKLRLSAQPLRQAVTRDASPALLLLAGAVGFVLLIACVNVANLMLARGRARQRELAIRRAMGAEGGRLIRQLLTESLILAVVSGGAGLILATLGLDVLGRLGYAHLPLQSRIAMDGNVALFALALSVATSLVFGLLPAWKLASDRTWEPLKGGRAETAAPGMRRLQRLLVVAEVALSIVPLVCGGLMLRTFLNLAHAPIGFNPAGIVTAKVPVSFHRFPGIGQRWPLHRNILDQVRALPGVEAVSAASPLPFASAQVTRRCGRPDQPDVPGILSTQQSTMPEYLRITGTVLLQGRDFTEDDIETLRPVTIVDEHLARRLWPEGALGRSMTVEAGRRRQVLEIIGVTAPVRVTRVRDENIPHFFVPYHIYPIEMSLVVKSRDTAAALGPLIQHAVGSQTGRAVFDVRPLESYVADSIGDTRFTMIVLASFAGASLLLASVGLYGTLAYLISQRGREFGIRLALGSSMGRIIGMVLREGTVLTAAGGLIGLAGAAAITRVIRQLLYNVAPFDPITLVAVVAVVFLVALAAASGPAWRATRIDPGMCLRSE